jgi:PAS domain S-box-containing protein
VTMQTGKVRILLLEDSEIDADLIIRQIGKLGEGMIVDRAVIRRDYEHLLDTHDFQLILSDYSLPDFNGVDALKIARERDVNIPFVFISGVLGEEFATEALRAGATDYVTKRNLSRIPMVVKRALVEGEERRERLRTSEALKESEHRFRVMADAAPALIWSVDENAKVIFANERLQSEFGIEPSSFMSEGWKALVHDDDWDWFNDERMARFTAREDFHADVRVRTAGGRVRWLRCESRPRRGEDGEFHGYIGCAVDITDAKLVREALEAEIDERTEELRVKEEALRQAQKMEAIGQLTGGIAHDFNNMLAGIIGSADLLKRRLRDGRYEDCNRYVDAVTAAANRAASLTQRLLAFSRQQTLDLHATPVDQRIRSLEDLLRRTIGPSIALELDLPAGLWPAMTDPSQFESSIINLVINARDAMPDGGSLVIKGANATSETGDFVEISISDTGTGMDEATLAKAIDPFFTTKPIGQGTGLGLSMVYGFLRQTGGDLRIRSALGDGTTLTLILPRASRVNAETAVSDTPQLEPRSDVTATVYVVEDEAIVRMLVVDHLQDLGYTVIEAGSAEQALPSFADGQRIDLLLTDVGLPGMDGRQLATEVRKLRPNLPIIFATGYADGAGRRSDLVGDNMDLVAKPFDVDDLAQRIGALLSP